MSHSSTSTIRKSDRKAGQILGVTITRTPVDVPKKQPQPGVVEGIKNHFRLGRSANSGSSSQSGLRDGAVSNVPKLFPPPYSNPELVFLPALTRADISYSNRFQSVDHDHVAGGEGYSVGVDEHHEGDVSEAEERARNEKARAKRSRQKVLAILGQEADRAV